MGCTSSQPYVSPHDLPSRRTFSRPSTFGSSLDLDTPRSPPSYEEVCRQIRRSLSPKI